MTDAVPATQTAQPKTYSVYGDQAKWVKEEAARLTEKMGRPFNPSKVIQHLIDQARSKQKGRK